MDMFQGLDHLAIVVPDTQVALKLWRDTMGFPVVCSEVVNNNTVLLTHLDLGNTHLQLVQPLVEDHPLQGWLKENGSGLHHFCLKVNNVDEALTDGPVPAAASTPHQGTEGKRALFFDSSHTNGIIVEVTGS